MQLGRIEVNLNPKKVIPILLVVAALVSSYFLPEIGGMGQKGWSSLAILAFAVVFWSIEVIPIAATSLIILVLIPVMGILDYAETFNSMGTVIIWRLMAIFIITAAVQKVGLANRIAFYMLLLAKGKVKRTLLYTLTLCFLLSLIVPNSYARTSLLVTAVAGWLEVSKIEKQSNIGKAFMISIPVVATLTATTIIVGASVDIFAAHMFEVFIGYQWTFLYWMVAFAPFCAVITYAVYFVAVLVFPPEIEQVVGSGSEIRERLDKLGPIQSREWFVICVFVGLMVLWFINVSELVPVELMAALVLILPHRFNIIEFKESLKSVSWDVLLIFGSSISMSVALDKSGAISYFSETIFSRLDGIHPAIIALIVIFATVVIRVGVVNMVSAVAVLLPLLITMAIGININPLWLGVICVIASCGAFFIPAQSANNLFSYNYGYYQVKDILKFGLAMIFVFAAILTVYALVYFPLIGISIH